MKRSEMIQKIKKIFNDMDDMNGLTDYGAELILNRLEELGMSPPFSHSMFHKNWQKSNRTVQNGNEWDPEDDDNHPRSGVV